MQGLGWGRLAIALTQTLHPRCACARWVILPSKLHQRLIILGPAGRAREAMSMTVDVSLVLCARIMPIRYQHVHGGSRELELVCRLFPEG